MSDIFYKAFFADLLKSDVARAGEYALRKRGRCGGENLPSLRIFAFTEKRLDTAEGVADKQA